MATASGVWYWLVLSTPFTVTISRSCGNQFGSSLCLKWIVFLFSVGITLSVNVNKVLIVRTNITYRCSTIVLYYTLQHVSAVLASYHQTDVGHTEKIISFCVSDIYLMMDDLHTRNMFDCAIKDYCTISIWYVWSDN